MEYQYLYDINDKKNWLSPILQKEPNGDVWEDAHTIQGAIGPKSLYRMTDSVFYPQPASHIHFHHKAHEIFFWSMSDFYLYIDGKKTRIEPGCITLFRPYEPHGFEFFAPTRKVSFFHGMENSQEDVLAGGLLRERRPLARSSPEFPIKGTMLPDFVEIDPPADLEEVPWQSLPNVRTIDTPQYVMDFDGISMRMIFARWENSGNAEIWGAKMQKGVTVKSNLYPLKMEMFYVTEGAVKFHIYDDEFIAHKECMVKIPKYAQYTMEVLEDSVIYDVGGQTQWFLFFEEYKSYKKFSPEKFNDPEAMAALKRKHSCEILEIGKK